MAENKRENEEPILVGMVEDENSPEVSFKLRLKDEE